MNLVQWHYDLLIEENNDPVLDPAPLRAYMDQWDGPGFIQRLGLDGAQRVMEIGVGTGRLALRTAPLCAAFYGVDISEKSLQRAGQHLRHLPQVYLIPGNFLEVDLPGDLDVIYSSLTFMHIEQKEAAIRKAAALLKRGGRFLLSIDKNPADVIDMGSRRIPIFPDDPAKIRRDLMAGGLMIQEQYETEMAHIFLAIKEKEQTHHI